MAERYHIPAAIHTHHKSIVFLLWPSELTGSACGPPSCSLLLVFTQAAASTAAAKSTGGAADSALQRENQRLRKQIAALQDQLDEANDAVKEVGAIATFWACCSVTRNALILFLTMIISEFVDGYIQPAALPLFYEVIALSTALLHTASMSSDSPAARATSWQSALQRHSCLWDVHV